MNASTETHAAPAECSVASAIATGVRYEKGEWGDRIRALTQELRRSLENATVRLRAQIGRSPLAARAAAAFHSSSRYQRAAVGSLLLLGFVASTGLFVTSKSANDPAQRVLAQWLDAQLAGGTGAEFMLPPADGARLHFHSLRKWRLLSKPGPGLFLVELGADRSNGTTAVGECRVTVAKASPASGASGLKVVHVDFDPSSGRGR
jgi:hypothetical protein